jgi:ribokinase
MDSLNVATAHVVGSINRDIVAYVPRLPRPGETVLGTRGALFPGGKGANQAVAIARLDGPCRMIGCVGADSFGADMRAFLADENIDVSGVAVRDGQATGFALITVDGTGENSITVVPGANHAWPKWGTQLQFAAGDIVVAQLEVPVQVVISAFTSARAVGAETVLNPAPYQSLPDDLMAATSTLVLNETEFAELAGFQGSVDIEDLTALGAQLKRVSGRGPSRVILTLGARGALVWARGEPIVRVSGHRVEARDATGAGDCFVGAFVSARLRGEGFAVAARFANGAAALSVMRDGAAMSYPRRTDVEAFLASAFLASAF